VTVAPGDKGDVSLAEVPTDDAAQLKTPLTQYTAPSVR
jgi:hypothetical protein